MKIFKENILGQTEVILLIILAPIAIGALLYDITLRSKKTPSPHKQTLNTLLPIAIPFGYAQGTRN